MIYDLPQTVQFGGREWAINTDFRDILTILEAFDDPELSNSEKAYICLHNFYVDFNDIPKDQMQSAYDAAIGFIDHNNSEDKKKQGPRTMDWQQDARIIFPAINRVAGFEVRSAEYLHWWSFMGFFLEIRESTAATVFALRQKKAKGKKLEKWEQEYWRDNRALCELRKKLTDDEKAEKARLNELLGG